MKTKKAVTDALKARKVKFNASGASLDELKGLLKEVLGASVEVKPSAEEVEKTEETDAEGEEDGEDEDEDESEDDEEVA
jgi:hypothetical protein